MILVRLVRCLLMLACFVCSYTTTLVGMALFAGIVRTALLRRSCIVRGGGDVMIAMWVFYLFLGVPPRGQLATSCTFTALLQVGPVGSAAEVCLMLGVRQQGLLCHSYYGVLLYRPSQLYLCGWLSHRSQ